MDITMRNELHDRLVRSGTPEASYGKTVRHYFYDFTANYCFSDNTRGIHAVSDLMVTIQRSFILGGKLKWVQENGHKRRYK